MANKKKSIQKVQCRAKIAVILFCSALFITSCTSIPIDNINVKTTQDNFDWYVGIYFTDWEHMMYLSDLHGDLRTPEAIRLLRGYDLDLFHLPVDISYILSTVEGDWHRPRSGGHSPETRKEQTLLEGIGWLFPFVLSEKFDFIEHGHISFVPYCNHCGYEVNTNFGINPGEFWTGITLFVTREPSDIEKSDVLHFTLSNLIGTAVENTVFNFIVE